MKRIVLGMMVAAIGINLMAQMEAGGIDTLTIGSSATYEVTPDPAIAADANMNASQFNWFFTDASDNPISSGIVVTETPDGGTGYYAESTINVAYTAGTYPAGTSIKVKTAEVSQPIYGTGCMGSNEEVGVFFVPVPTVAVNGTSAGGCGITTQDIPLNITGYGPYDITFTVEYNDAGTTSTFTETIGAVSNKGGSTHALNLTVNTTTHMTSGSGKYDIVITNIVDRFSSKSTAAIAGSVGASAFTIGINPTPTTQPIRHIQNL